MLSRSSPKHARLRRPGCSNNLLEDVVMLLLKIQGALEDFAQGFHAKAAEFEAATTRRSEELALAKARAVISEKTGGAESFSFGLNQTP